MPGSLPILGSGPALNSQRGAEITAARALASGAKPTGEKCAQRAMACVESERPRESTGVPEAEGRTSSILKHEDSQRVGSERPSLADLCSREGVGQVGWG